MGGVSSSAMEVRALAPTFEPATDFESLYRQYFGFAWASLRRLGVPTATIDDAAQDLWVTVHRRLETLDPAASVKAWLFGIARRVASHYRRSEQRHRRKLAAYTAADVRGKNEPMKRREASLTMETFLAKLDESKRVAFVLSEVEGWSAPEIARVAGTNPNTVYSRVRLAKEQLRKHLQDADSELSPKECVEAMRSSTAAPPDAAKRCWMALAPKLATGVVTSATATGGALAKLKLVLVGALLGGAGVVGMDAALPENPSPTPVAAAAPRTQPSPSAAPTAPAPKSVAAAMPLEAPEEPAAEPEPAPAPKPRAARPASKPEPVVEAPSNDLAAQTALLERAKGQLAAGKHDAALKTLTTHARQHPDSPLADIRQLLEVDVLCKAGRTKEARGRATAYAQATSSPTAAKKLRTSCPE
ncbi:MAG: sigma-70 family RNA polymerase sigma factor [Myxococcota bacterium]